MKIKADLHVHSMYSKPVRYDWENGVKDSTPEKILEYAFNKSKLDVIAVTDTNRDLFFNEVVNHPEEYLPKNVKLAEANNEIALFEKSSVFGKRKLYLLRGIEHSDKQKGNLIQIGGKSQIKPHSTLSLKEKIGYAHYNHAIIGVPHPFHKELGGIGEKRLEKITKDIYFVEVFDSINKREYDEKALKFAEENNLTGISGSNEYNSKPGRTYTILNVKLTGSLSERADSIKNAIKNNKIKGHCQKSIGFFESLYVFALKDALLFNSAEKK
ncbi:MAG: hypothetical protein WAX79_06115 [Candidatus Omnitrophota bacterium]